MSGWIVAVPIGVGLTVALELTARALKRRRIEDSWPAGDPPSHVLTHPRPYDQEGEQ